MLRGYLLHSRPFKDTSVLVNLLVDGQGRVDAVARVGSGKRSLKSILQPFQPLIFSLTGRSSLKSVINIEAASPAVPLYGEVSYAGFYLNELLVRCMAVDHGGESLFLTYHKTLMAMAASFSEAQLRYFELTLLQELGLMPTLEYDIQGDRVEADYYYRLLPEQGLVSALGPKRTHYHGEMLNALTNLQLEPQHLSQAKGLMRQLLAPILGDKPLKSRALFIKK